MEETDKELERVAEEVRITLEKLPGMDTFRREISASSTEALVNGLAALLIASAGMLEVPVSRVFVKLAKVLFSPEEERNQKEAGNV